MQKLLRTLMRMGAIGLAVVALVAGTMAWILEFARSRVPGQRGASPTA